MTFSEDWLKTKSWGFPGVTTTEQLRRQLAGIGYPWSKRTGLVGPGQVMKFLRMPAAVPMPEPLLRETVSWLAGYGHRPQNMRLAPELKERIARLAPNVMQGSINGLTVTITSPVTTARLAYSPEQERDESGKWTAGGGGGDGASTPTATTSVDKLIADNPKKPGEASFEWQSRIVQGLSPQDQSDVLFKVREQYEPVGYIVEGVHRWNEEHDIPPPDPRIVDTPVDLDEANEVARYYEEAPDASDDPKVREAYDDFKEQNKEMYDFVTKPESEGGLGITVTFTDKVNPYPDATSQANDLRENRHIFIESGLGGAHESTMSVREYDEFRAVHDVFGHAGVGGGFDRHGEYQAWLEHSSMYADPGRLAMSTEYHGVNSAMWSGEPGTPGTGKSLLLPPEMAEPPWERAKTSAAGEPKKSKLDLDELIEKLALDKTFAQEFDDAPWHRHRKTKQGYSPDQERDESGRFSTGGGGGGGGGERENMESSIIDRTREYGGYSILPLTGQEPKDGYMVALGGTSTIIPAETFFGDRDHAVDVLDKYLADHAHEFDEAEAWLGTWYDEANEEVVLDIAVNIADEKQALVEGVRENQQEIYDVKAGDTLRTGGTGARDTAQQGSVDGLLSGGDDA